MFVRTPRVIGGMSLKVPSPISAAVSPASIFGANLVAWYNANNGVSQSSGNVSAWTDQSGNGHNLSNTGTGNMTFSATGFNSQPGITIAATGNSLTSPQFNINTPALSAFMVVETPGSFVGDARWLSYQNSGENDFSATDAILLFASFGTGGFESIQDSVTVNDAIAVSTNARCALTYSSGGMLTPYLNNVAGAPQAGVANTIGSATGLFYLGFNPTGGGSNAQAGLVIAEIVIANIVANSTQLTALDNYFRSKWGL
jgi:hypothetical protein